MLSVPFCICTSGALQLHHVHPCQKRKSGKSRQKTTKAGGRPSPPLTLPACVAAVALPPAASTVAASLTVAASTSTFATSNFAAALTVAATSTGAPGSALAALRIPPLLSNPAG